jgi:hypothetical protein
LLALNVKSIVIITTVPPQLIDLLTQRRQLKCVLDGQAEWPSGPAASPLTQMLHSLVPDATLREVGPSIFHLPWQTGCPMPMPLCDACGPAYQAPAASRAGTDNGFL